VPISHNQKKYKNGQPSDWATESMLAAKEAYTDRATRLYQAGIRLGTVLNEVFED
jgi:hypothetical protein